MKSPSQDQEEAERRRGAAAKQFPGELFGFGGRNFGESAKTLMCVGHTSRVSTTRITVVQHRKLISAFCNPAGSPWASAGAAEQHLRAQAHRGRGIGSAMVGNDVALVIGGDIILIQY
jgi:hypothetical protein